MRLWVWSRASLSGLRIRHCRELWCSLKTWLGYGYGIGQRLQLWLDPPAWKPSYAMGVALEKTKKRKKRKKERNTDLEYINKNIRITFWDPEDLLRTKLAFRHHKYWDSNSLICLYRIFVKVESASNPRIPETKVLAYFYFLIYFKWCKSFS